MSDTQTHRRLGLAKVALGLSVLFALGAFGYLSIRGRPVAGVGLGTILVIGGVWEYVRRRQDLRASNRYEAEAERHSRRRRR